MLTSDSDDDIFLAVNVGGNDSRPGPSHSISTSTRAAGSNEGEPPRRRRRIEDVPVSPISHRTRNRNPASVSVPQHPVAAATATGPEIHVLETRTHSTSSVTPQHTVSVVRSAQSSSVVSQPPANNEVVIRIEQEFPDNSSHGSSTSYNSDDDDVISVSSFVSHSDSLIFIDSDEESEEPPEFEPFDLDDLSDVEVVRVSDDDNESEASEHSASEGEADESESSEAQPGSAYEAWRASHSRARRNAIVDVNQNPEIENAIAVDNAAAIPNLLDAPPPPVQDPVSVDAPAGPSNNPGPAAVTTSVKAPDLNESVKSDDEDGLTCVICYEPFTNSGEHRLCCLKCGHTYGQICIEKWIKSEARCPQCNSKARKADIRVLYVKNLKALDTSERDRVIERLNNEQELKRKLELECARLRQMNQHKETEYKIIHDELVQLKAKCGSVYREPGSSSQQPSTSASTFSGAQNANAAGSSQLKFSHLKSIDFQAECRVGAYNEYYNMLVVSQNVKSALYPQGMYGIRRVNLLDMRVIQQTPIHQKEIRDLKFSPQQIDILLSVGMDKRAILTDTRLNVSVQTFNSDYALWSCDWNKVSPHLFYAGSANGMLLTYDIRNPRELARSDMISASDKTAIGSICFVPPSYKKATALTSSGILIQRLQSIWFCELRNEDPIFHQLPVEGSFQSLQFEPNSRHALFSTRHPSSPARHMVCDLTQYYSDVQNTNVCSCNVVQTYEGVAGVSGKMCRSSIFSPADGKVLVSANGPSGSVNVWDVSDPSWKRVLSVPTGGILDIVPSRVETRFMLNMINGTGVSVFGVHY